MIAQLTDQFFNGFMAGALFVAAILLIVLGVTL